MKTTEKTQNYVPATRRNGDEIDGLKIRNGVFYSLFHCRGKNIRRRCPYTAMGDAEGWLADLKKEMLEGAPASQRFNTARIRSEWPTVEEVCQAYLAMVPGRYAVRRKPHPTTAKRNVWQFENLLRELHGTENVKTLRFGPDLLNGRSVEKFMVSRMTAAGPKDKLLEQRARITAGSTMAQARSLFSKWTRPQYKEAGITLPQELWDWFDAIESQKPSKYEERPPELIALTMAGIKEKSLADRIAFALCYNFGLRRDEALHARWDWVFPYADGSRAIRILGGEDGHGWKKSKTGKTRLVPATADVWALLEEGKAGEWIIPGRIQNERKAVLDEVGDWMRTVGWDARRFSKTLHELRKLAGSKWCQAVGPQRAADWLGDTLQTALHFYVDIIGQHKPVEM